MRLRRLDLTRYGRFTDYRIDFGDAEPGRPDLHVIYGPNEAGKSTTLCAFLDLLFGIGTSSDYAFLHPYATMRIGAALDLDGGCQEFARIKRPQNSLLNHNDQPVAGAGILADLGGIDREVYRTMFSLDDEKLEEGGKSILASKGDLGQLLFSASAGLADLSRGLIDLGTETQGFYKFKARSGTLSDLKKRLADLKAERDKIDMLASDYARLIQDRDRTAGLYDGTLASRGLIQTRMDEIGRQLNALPRLAALRRARDALTPFADLPDAPRHWGADLPGLQRQEIELGVRETAVAQEIEQGVARLDAIAVDEEALRLAERFERLPDLRAARHITADEDLPSRRQRLRDAEGTIAGLLRRIERDGEADPGRLILGASVTGRLRDLIEARSGVEAAMKSAVAELSTARRRAEDAAADLRAAEGGEAPRGGRQGAMAALAATVAALRSDDHAARRRLADRSGEAHRATLADRLHDLRPWRGDADALHAMVIPDADVRERWKTVLAETRKRIERHAGEAERLTSERRRHEAERDAIGGLTGVVTDQDAAGIRARRDEWWTEHRRRLDAPSADAFEVALRNDDRVTSGRFGHVADLAKLHQASQALAVASAEGARAAELRDAATEALRVVEEEIAEAIRGTAPALSSLTPQAFDSWLARRLKALETRDLLGTAEREARGADADANAARQRLAAALDEAGCTPEPQAGLDRLLIEAQTAIDRDTTLQALLAAVDDRRREVEARERQSEDASREERGWTRAWSETCSACWLADGGTVPPLATVREILPALSDLAAALKDANELADRIDKMEKDQAAFQAEIVSIAGALHIEAAARPALEVAQAIDDRIRVGRADHERRHAETHKLEAARERQLGLTAALDIHRGHAREMTEFFGVETLAEVARGLADGEKGAALRRQAAEAEQDVLDALRAPTLGEAERMLDMADRAALEAELGTLKTRFDDLDQRCRDLFLTQSKAADAVVAIGGDARVAEIEERRSTTLMEIEDGARRYLKLRAGILATEWALRAYRDTHRSSMLEKTSETFSTISRGAYRGLAAQPEKDGESLIALTASGGSKQAVELSKGTRFQLYLALRVAGYHEFARNRRAVPFIADDIMETFDDFRAEETFRIFAGMAGVGQVIYLTHHRHLCDIARSVCPSVRLHAIGGP